MSPRFLSLLILVVLFGLFSGKTARGADETEPNDTSSTANALIAQELMNGAINPAADLDYFALNGITTTWGFIALLETDQSATGQDGVLTALGSDGTTILQQDSGSWSKGSGIALQNYVDANATHYFRVGESGDDQTISAYTLRYYNTIMVTWDEVEPNETTLTGTTSSYTHTGVLATAGDQDCYAFQGRAGDTVLVALKGDPEGDSSPVDPVLELRDETNAVLTSANVAGVGGNEFIEYENLGDGVYAYCVRAGSGTEGAGATYMVGLVRNGYLYNPDYTLNPVWQNLEPGNVGQVGDIFTLKLAFNNNSPLDIPENINMSVRYSTTCLAYIDASQAPSSIYTPTPGTDQINWYDQKTGIAAGEEYSITVNFRALAPCTDEYAYQSTGIIYYSQGRGKEVFYTILPRPFFWPAFLPAMTGRPQQ